MNVIHVERKDIPSEVSRVFNYIIEEEELRILSVFQTYDDLLTDMQDYIDRANEVANVFGVKSGVMNDVLGIGDGDIKDKVLLGQDGVEIEFEYMVGANRLYVMMDNYELYMAEIEWMV